MTTPPHMSIPPPPAPTVIAVCSGKGGVGKSTMALNVAVAPGLDGARVGLLDADVQAPDIPLMVGLARTAPAKGWTLSRARGTELEPVERYGVKVMPGGFFVAEDQAVTLTAGLVDGSGATEPAVATAPESPRGAALREAAAAVRAAAAGSG